MASSDAVGNKQHTKAGCNRSGRHLTARAFALLAAVLLAACASLTQPRANDHLARVELLALLQTLNADLLSHASATLTLERWCAAHHLAEPPRILVRRMRDAARAIPDELQSKLGADAGPIRYRHVQLMCGERVLSEADNWYVADALTPAMNERLDTTDEPFGKVVQPLGLERRTLSADLLWSPLPAGWEMKADSAPPSAPPLRIPPSVLRHRAILYSSNGVAFSALEETYTNQLFAFGGWARYTVD
jgi:chorismate-pyruvate lyase